MTALWTRLHAEGGATMTEYAIMIGVVALVAIAGATLLGTALDGFFSGAESTVSGL